MSNQQNIYDGYTVYKSNHEYSGYDYVKSKNKKRKIGHKLGISGKLRLSFIFVGAVFFLVIFGVFAAVWFHYFNNYEQENLDTYSSAITSDLRHIYMEEGCWNQRVVDYIDLFGYTRVGLAAMLKDPDGNIITYSLHSEQYANYVDKEAFVEQNQNVNNLREEDVVLDNGEVVGRLALWMYGDTRLAQEDDLTFMANTLFWICVSFIVSMIIAVLLSFVFVKWFSRPINKMVIGAKEIAKGNFSHRVNLGGSDEFAILGRTIDDMAQSIEKIQKIERSLTHDIAHELKTPLASLQATIEAIIDGVYEPTEERLLIIDNEVKRLSRLVESMLNLSRIENRKIVVNKTIFDFNSVAEKCSHLHRIKFADAGIDFTYDIKGEAYVCADKDLILQAITNLISNAYRYTPRGGHVSVSTEVKDGFVRLHVKDSGIGIAEEDKEKLFMRFFRSRDASAADGGGSGVGLPIVKQIIDIHSGIIAVKSELGKGSCFIIGIPIVKDEEEK